MKSKYLETAKWLNHRLQLHIINRFIAYLVKTFVDAIIDLIENPQQATAMGKKGRAFVEHMDWSSIASRYLALAGEK